MEEDDETRKKIIKQVIKEVDEKVYKWMSTRQTKFKRSEKDEIQTFSNELIAYLNSLRTTNKNPTDFQEKIVSLHLGNKIIYLMETINQCIYGKQ
jgi:arsenate reductase-like glutaredoxin family protein